jgi:cytochrome b-561 domain-containing protein 2
VLSNFVAHAALLEYKVIIYLFILHIHGVMSISYHLGYVQSLSILCCVSIVVAVLPAAYARTLFAWHPIFMSIGYLGFMCEGIAVALRARDVDGNARVSRLMSHMWVQLSSIFCASLGFAAIYVNKSIHGKNHFTSLHGKLGLITYMMSLAVAALGISSFKHLGLIEALPASLHPTIKWIHRMVCDTYICIYQCIYLAHPHTCNCVIQAGVTTWSLSIVAMEVVLPHSSVMTGVFARLWQVAVLLLAFMVINVLSGASIASKANMLPQIVDFTLIPQSRDNKLH